MEKQPLGVYNYGMDFSRPDNARAINRLKVLSELRTGECSRAELSRRLGINKVSIGDMIQDMIAEGLVTEGHFTSRTSRNTYFNKQICWSRLCF